MASEKTSFIRLILDKPVGRERKERKEKEKKRERESFGERSSTFSLNFRTIKPAVSGGARRKVHRRS